jgi:hypothetical protein
MTSNIDFNAAKELVKVICVGAERKAALLRISSWQRRGGYGDAVTDTVWAASFAIAMCRYSKYTGHVPHVQSEACRLHTQLSSRA